MELYLHFSVYFYWLHRENFTFIRWVELCVKMELVWSGTEVYIQGTEHGLWGRWAYKAITVFTELHRLSFSVNLVVRLFSFLKVLKNIRFCSYERLLNVRGTCWVFTCYFHPWNVSPVFHLNTINHFTRGNSTNKPSPPPTVTAVQ